MIIRCLKEDIYQGLQSIQRAIPTKSFYNSIQSGIYISAKNSQIELQATDTEISIIAIVNADVIEEGSLILNGKYLHEIIRKMYSGYIDISLNNDDNTVLIKQNQAQFNLLSVQVDDFPVIQRLPENKNITLNNNVLCDLVKHTVFACSNDESRPIFTGALLSVQDNCVTMAATNTYLLAIKKDKIDTDTSFSAIIPAKTLNETARLVASEEVNPVNIIWHNNQVAFSYKNIYLISRLINGEFPDYKRVVPESFASNAVVETAEMVHSLGLASLIATNSGMNAIKFIFKEDSLTINSNNPDIGMGTQTIPISLSGDNVEISFREEYISGIMKNILTEKTRIGLNNYLSSV